MTGADQVRLDFDRENRTGLAEAVYCQGKSREQLVTICETLKTSGRPMLFTKLTSDQYDSLKQEISEDFLGYDPVSQTAFHQPYQNRSQNKVAIVTGGSSDVPVAAETARTLEFYGHVALSIHDVGVAGLWRVTEKLDEIRSASVVVCIAGMDAALPTVLGGLIPGSIIAVPTSVGYGMVKGGETALRSMLVSCAPGLVVVNIDNGYGAACAAIRILNNR